MYFSRRQFLRQVGAAGVALAGGFPQIVGCQAAAEPSPNEPDPLAPGVNRPDVLARFPAARAEAFGEPLGDRPLTDARVAATHNNFYEFLPGRGGAVHRLVGDFVVDPWQVEVSGEVARPRTFDLDDLFRLEQEERVYRFRCVETWSMTLPWTGVPLGRLLALAEPTGHAKYVRFISAADRAQMPGIEQSIQQRAGYPWPYHEALRIDEAMNELTLAVTGVYGRPLPKQHGAPLRIIVPWKYGYKSPKSIVKIELVREQPPTFWSTGPYRHEYGFLSNVNPNVPHPRWSQEHDYLLVEGASPREGPRRKTEIFNGYGTYVAKLYPDEPKTPQPPLRRGQVAR